MFGIFVFFCLLMFMHDERIIFMYLDYCADMLSVEKLPLKFFMGEIYGGNSLRSTTSIGNDIKRQRVYNTMFHVPWRCELVSFNSLSFILEKTE